MERDEILAGNSVGGVRFAPVVARELPPIVGREDEIDHVRRLLAEGARLVTITGPGGVGKTRLALEVASTSGRPALVVALSAVSDAVAVLPAILRTAGWTAAEEQPTLDVIRDAIGGEPALIVLDTAEHLPGVGAEVESLLDVCPHLSVLVTSRTAIRAANEIRVQVAPLGLPPPVGEFTLDEARNSDAVTMLVQTVRRDAPDFELTESNLRLVSEICRRLDGLPLAIELAAARLRLLAPDRLLALLGRPLAVLASRDQPDHHRTLAATIDWSVQLLDPVQQERFVGLAVFPATFDLVTAAEVLGVDLVELLDDFEALVDHHLVRQAPREQGDERRFEMLDTVREYALRRLDDDQQIQLRWSLARWCARLGRRTEAELEGPAPADALQVVDQEYATIDSSMSWLASRAELDDAAATDLLLEVVASLWRYWLFRGRTREGSIWIERALELAADRRSQAVARGWYVAGELAEQLGELQLADRRFSTAAEASLALGDEIGAAEAWNGIGMVARTRGDLVRARDHHQRALDVFARTGRRRREASALHHLAATAYFGDDPELAAQLWSRTLEIVREVGDERSRGVIVSNLGSVHLGLGDLDAAALAYEEAIQVAERIGDLAGLATALNNVIELRLLAGDLVGIDALIDRTRDTAAASEFALASAVLVHHQGRLAALRGRLGDAASLFAASWHRFVELGVATSMPSSLEQLAVLAAELGRWEVAEQLVLDAARSRRQVSEPIGPDAECLATWTAAIEEALGRPIGRVDGDEDDDELDEDDELDLAVVTQRIDALAAAARGVVRRPDSRVSPVAIDAHGLTRREAQVAELLVDRRTDQEIADALYLSRRTVTTHVSAILRKLGVASRRDVGPALRDR